VKRQQFLVAHPIVGHGLRNVADVTPEHADEAVLLEYQKKRVPRFLKALREKPWNGLFESSDPQ